MSQLSKIKSQIKQLDSEPHARIKTICGVTTVVLMYKNTQQVSQDVQTIIQEYEVTKVVQRHGNSYYINTEDLTKPFQRRLKKEFSESEITVNKQHV